MDIIRDHGDFAIYDPPEHPLKVHRVVFCKRVSDGCDWYKLVRELRGTGTLKMILVRDDDELVVRGISHDAEKLFPGNGRLVEVSGETDPQVFANKHFDGKTFIERVPKPPLPTIIDILIEELGLDAEKLRRKVDAARKKAGERKHG